jgi:hypothetical protein
MSNSRKIMQTLNQNKQKTIPTQVFQDENLGPNASTKKAATFEAVSDTKDSPSGASYPRTILIHKESKELEKIIHEDVKMNPCLKRQREILAEYDISLNEYSDDEYAVVYSPKNSITDSDTSSDSDFENITYPKIWPSFKNAETISDTEEPECCFRPK